MKNIKSKIKPMEIGKQSGTTYCFGCRDYTKNFRPQEVKMINKVFGEKSHCVVCWSNKLRFKKKKKKLMLHIKIRWRLIAWSVEKILKILTQKCLEQKIID